MSSPDAAFSDQEISQHSADADSADFSLAISAKKSSRRPAYERDCAGQFQLPRWYRGNMLPREATRKVSEVGSLRGLEFGIMDEILNEKMTNRDFCATNISRYLGVGCKSLNQAFWMHNMQKIEFGMLAPDTSITAPQIKSRLRIWKSYRKFIDQGGCSEPFDPQVLGGLLAAVLFPKLNNIDKIKEGYVVQQSLKGRPLPEWSGIWRQGGPAKLAAQVSGIVPSSGEGDKPFPPPRLPPAPRPPPHAALRRQASLKEARPLGALQTLPSPKKARVPYLPPEKVHCFLARGPRRAPQERSWRAGLKTLNSRRSPTHPRHCRATVAAVSPQWPHTFGPSSLFPRTPAEALRARLGQLHGPGQLKHESRSNF
jgi:hypothetical protein